MNLKINLIMLLKSGRDAKKKGFEIKSLKVKTISFSLMQFSKNQKTYTFILLVNQVIFSTLKPVRTYVGLNTSRKN